MLPQSNKPFPAAKKEEQKNSADITRILIPLGWAVALMYAGYIQS